MDLASIIKHYEPALIQRYGAMMSYDQRRALSAMRACRTERYGEMVMQCNNCQQTSHCYHSCGHRNCPRCQNHETTLWLERQRQKLLPVEYFMVTFTLPYELRALTRRHQKSIYGALFSCAIETLKQFGINDRKLGAAIAMTAVLHTHSRRLDYHPHLHVVIPGGCLNKKRRQWKSLQGKYLFNEFSLAVVFRAKLLEAIHGLDLPMPSNLPNEWVVDCQHVGRGKAALEYLSRYLYRGVLLENNILADDGQQVTFKYTDSETKATMTRTLKGEDFLWLLLQHVLPKGFRRARDFGFLHGNAKKMLALIQRALRVLILPQEEKARPSFRCALCKTPMHIVAFIPPLWRPG